jgi:hypothetical protein
VGSVVHGWYQAYVGALERLHNACGGAVQALGQTRVTRCCQRCTRLIPALVWRAGATLSAQDDHIPKDQWI